MAATPPLATSLLAAKARGGDPARCGFELSRHILLGVREARANRPDLVLKYGGYLLQNHASSLSHEVWAAYEQVCVSLLQHSRHSERGAPPDSGTESEEIRAAQEYIAALSARFSGSLRVKRLEGMMWEAKGEHDLALADYDEILEEDPHNLQAIRRQVAICRSRGRYGEAAKRLIDYLQTFCSDTEGWLMLTDLYLLAQQYKRAAFCMEELILINPMNYIYHIRAGEICYTLGTAAHGGSHYQLLTARKYFAHTLELKPEANLRALYGMLLACSVMGNSTKGKGTKVDVQDVLGYVSAQLTKCYTPAAGPPHPMRAIVMAMVKKLASTAADKAPVAQGA